MSAARRSFRIYAEATGYTFAVVSAASETAALLGVSWGYAGPTLRRDESGRPYMDCVTGTYRAEPGTA